MREITVTAWSDPVVERLGHPADSGYVERYYLPTIGPSTWALYRRLAETVATGPQRVDIDLLAKCIGITQLVIVDRTVRRLYTFRLARVGLGDVMEVRTVVPDITSRMVAHLPAHLRAQHASDRAMPRTAVPA